MKKFYLKKIIKENYLERYKDKNNNIIFIEKERDKKIFSMTKKYKEYLYNKKKENLLRDTNNIKSRLKYDYNDIDFNLLSYKLKEYYSL